MYAELKKDKRFKEVAQPAASTEETKKDKWNHGAEDTQHNLMQISQFCSCESPRLFVMWTSEMIQWSQDW